LLLTFDDGTQSQYDNALPELDRYGYKALFFIMTITLNKPDFMSREEIRVLSEQGHLIGCHTWDHHDVRSYNATDWKIQLVKPVQVLEQITGKPVRCFAYPFGSWNSAAIIRLKEQGFLAAFQLGGHTDNAEPRFTIRRILVDGHWDTPQLLNVISAYDRLKYRQHGATRKDAGEGL
ncbi:MAG TPA: polysaccharide deacetylase family protein, partial [Chitinophagaceae bacterium]|nr:polysaccharide deacetylase family protein [Chitinophagaceae bacterium]